MKMLVSGTLREQLEPHYQGNILGYLFMSLSLNKRSTFSDHPTLYPERQGRYILLYKSVIL